MTPRRRKVSAARALLASLGQPIEDQEAPKRHPNDPRQRRGDRAEAGNELGHKEGESPAACEEILRVPNAGVRFEGDPTERNWIVLSTVNPA